MDGQSEEEKRAEWLLARRGAIGASEAAAIVDEHPYLSQFALQQNKLGNLAEFEGNEATELGNACENVILDMAERKYGYMERQKRVVHPSLPLAATVDGLGLVYPYVFEAKTAGLVSPLQGELWGDAGTDEVPMHYMIQVQAALMCTGAELGILVALLGSRGIVEYHIEPRPALHEMLGNKIADWWHRHIVLGEEVSSKGTSMETIKRLRREKKEPVELGEDVYSKIIRLERVKKLVKRVNDMEEAAKVDVLAALGDHECGKLNDPDGGSITVEYLNRTRAGYTCETVTYRQLAIKRKKK